MRRNLKPPAATILIDSQNRPVFKFLRFYMRADRGDGSPPTPKASCIQVQFALTVPTIRDRVVQTSAKLVLEPIFEADFDPNAYGYRPKRSAQDAIRKVHKLLCDGYTEVVDADLSKYLDLSP